MMAQTMMAMDSHIPTTMKASAHLSSIAFTLCGLTGAPYYYAPATPVSRPVVHKWSKGLVGYV
jgi:hypothetical protein